MHLIQNGKPTVVKVEYMSKPCAEGRIKSVLIVNTMEFFPSMFGIAVRISSRTRNAFRQIN